MYGINFSLVVTPFPFIQMKYPVYIAGTALYMSCPRDETDDINLLLKWIQSKFYSRGKETLNKFIDTIYQPLRSGKVNF